MNAPLRFQPYLRPMPWGGRALGEILGKPLPDAQPYGESWEVSDHPSHRTHVASGPKEGATIPDLLRRDREALLGRGAAFPWLVKYLDCNDWLSVQVHPDERSVGRLWPGEGPKNEAWFVLAAGPASRVYAGLRPGMDEKRLRQALAAGKVLDCLHQFRPRPGDCLFLPAGTVHAVGGGVLMAEVQQTSDATFRLHDWDRRDAQGRPRTLHVEEALACIDWRAGPAEPAHAEGFPDGPGSARQRLVANRYFHLDYQQQAETHPWGGTGRLQVALVLHGRGRLRTAEGEQEVGAGDTLVLPAAMPAAECRPNGPLSVLWASLP
jgi:mannose-6-phosphate isomerase